MNVSQAEETATAANRQRAARRLVWLQFSERGGGAVRNKERQLRNRTLQTVMRTLDFILSVIESHWRILSRRVAQSALRFQRIILAAVWKIDYRERDGKSVSRETRQIYHSGSNNISFHSIRVIQNAAAVKYEKLRENLKLLQKNCEVWNMQSMQHTCANFICGDTKNCI